MEFLTCLLSNNRCYKTGTKFTPKGVMVHSTGANNPNLRRYVQPTETDPKRVELLQKLGVNNNHNDWNHTDPNACVHAFIGKLADGSVVVAQTLPWDMRGWHAGTGTSGKSANDTHISFEICEDGLADPAYFHETFEAAATLTARLCKEFNLDPTGNGVIICHQDGYRRGIASNHGDIYNWWPKHGYFMEDFVDRVLTIMEEGEDDMVYYKTLSEVPEYYKDALEKAVNVGALKGESEGVLNVSEDLCRILTILDRMGKLG